MNKFNRTILYPYPYFDIQLSDLGVKKRFFVYSYPRIMKVD